VAGASHTCAWLDDDSVKCWGFNFNGELGVGDATNRGDQAGELGDSLPPPRIGADVVSAISAGANHTCVVQTANVKCWGLGALGRLGTGDGSNRGDATGTAIVPVRFASDGGM
jgi:alpha-tubulin suppressor-like RCC1 family protein